MKHTYERLLDIPFHYYLVLICLTLVIIFGGSLGHFFGMKGIISPICPSTGIALAGLLFFGFKVLPAVVLGIFINKALLFVDLNIPVLKFFTGVCITTTADTLQVLTAFLLIKAFCSKKILNSLNDSIMFLIFGGAIACTISSTLSTPIFVWVGEITWSAAPLLWLKIWIGDTLGAVVIAPVIFIWGSNIPLNLIKKHFYEVILWFLVVSINMYTCFVFPYPMLQFSLITILWATFRLGFHGATFSTFIISTICFVGIKMGYELFHQWSRDASQDILVSFILMGAVAGLILAGILADRKKMFYLLSKHQKNLEDSINHHLKEINDISEEYDLRKRLTTLEEISKGVVHEIQEPLNNMIHYAKGTVECVQFIDKHMIEFQFRNDMINEKLSDLDATFQLVNQYTLQVRSVLNSIINHFGGYRNSISRTVQRCINSILNYCIHHIEGQTKERYPQLDLVIERHYDSAVENFEPHSNDIDRVIFYILENTLYYLNEKTKTETTDFKPCIIVTTKDLIESIAVSIKDNGTGIPKMIVHRIFSPFFSMKSPDQGIGLGLTLANEIVCREHHGKMRVHSIEGQFTEVTITLPKIKNHLKRQWKEK